MGVGTEIPGTRWRQQTATQLHVQQHSNRSSNRLVPWSWPVARHDPWPVARHDPWPVARHDPWAVARHDPWPVARHDP